MCGRTRSACRFRKQPLPLRMPCCISVGAMLARFDAVQEGGRITYLLLCGAEGLPLGGDELELVNVCDALEVARVVALRQEAVERSRWSLGLAVVLDLDEVLGRDGPCPTSFTCGQALLQQVARVVGQTDLLGGVGVEPGGVVSSQLLRSLVGQMVVVL
jgi:hypothetical protein